MAIRTFIELAEHLDIKPWVKQIGNWKRQYPIRMKKDGVTPEKIMRSINQVFHHAIIATDVVAISGDGGMQMNIQEMATAVVYELPIEICILNNGYLGNVRQWQELFFDRRYMSTCMRYRKSCAANCNNANSSASAKTCPEYTPDFIKLAESYGAKGIRVTEEKEIARALECAKNTCKVPTVIEFIIAREENVLPLVYVPLWFVLNKRRWHLEPAAAGAILTADFIGREYNFMDGNR